MNSAIESKPAIDARPDPLATPTSPQAPRHASYVHSSTLGSHLARGAVRLGLLLTLDLTAICAAGLLLGLLRAGDFGSSAQALAAALIPSGTVPAAQLTIAIVASFYFLGCYRHGDRWREPVKLLTATAIGTSIAFYAELWQGAALETGARAAVVWICLSPLLVAMRSLAARIKARLANGALKYHVLAITDDPRELDQLDLGPWYHIVATLTPDDWSDDGRVAGGAMSERVDTLLVHGNLPRDRFQAVTDYALTHNYRLLCAPHADHLLRTEQRHLWVGSHPLVELTTPAMRASHLVLKRVLDLSMATVAIIVSGPLFLVLSLWIRLDSPGPVLFKQKRPGIGGRPFWMLKFRSMRHDAEELLENDPELFELFLANGCKLPPDADPRITRVGRFLRRTSLDELPQLFNVIAGHMSLVGPRPLVGPELENYGHRVPTLLSVKPGMTGLWQVSGRSCIPFPERAEMDLDYVRTWSFLGDLWILLLTPAAVVVRRGAH